MTDIYKMIIVGTVGAIVAMIFYMEELITETTHDVQKIKDLGFWKIGFLVFANGVFGSVIMVSVFYGIMEHYPSFNPYFSGGISAMFAFMGKDAVRIFHKVVKAKAEKGGTK